MSADLIALVARLVLAPSAAMLLVLALRAPVRNAFGARVAYALWLLVPIVAAAAFLPARRFLVEAPSAAGAQAMAASQPMQITAASPVADIVQTAPSVDFIAVLVALWIFGFTLSIGLLIQGQRRLLSRLGTRDAENGVHIAADTVGPAVIGVIAPRIVVPADFAERYSETERALVLEHERAHIRAGDVQINAIAAFAQCLLWFNPIVYAARAALRVDQELACDERVMQRFGGARRIYAEAMLKAQFDARPVPLGCAWPALGARPLRQRIVMLGRPHITAPRRALGAALCAAITLAGGFGVWLAQPAQPAYASDRAHVRGSGARLIRALMQEDAAEAHRLIAAGADVNHWSPGDGTPLIIAARLEDAAAAEAISSELLRAGADVNKPAAGDGSPLIVASDRGEMVLVRLFVEAGADVNAVVRGDETPLINAARHGRVEAARYLIAHGADVNLAVDAPIVDGHERRSPLSMAERGGHTEMVRLLREAGALS